MKRTLPIISILFLTLCVSGCITENPTQTAFKLTSTDVQANHSLKSQQIFNAWGCTGDNQSPQLSWENAPKGTKSFAVTMYDPDAPTGSGWWHWVVINIPATTTSLNTDAGNQDGTMIPKGAQMQRNDFGYVGFGGACPPAGAKPHQYEITVYALNTEKLEVPASGSPALAGYNILQHTLDKAQIIAPTNQRN